MIVVRAVKTDDLDALVSLAHETGPGLTTFKPDRDALASRIARAQRTMQGHAAPHGCKLRRMACKCQTRRTSA